jgi:hypothetical protein
MDPMYENRTIESEIEIEEFYISRVNWLVGQGRDDLIDTVADEYERHVANREVHRAA